MSLSRYARTPIFGVNSRYGTSYIIPILRTNMEAGNIRFTEIVSKEKERLDILAGQVYGDARLWWLIAICSNVGFAPQVPPNMILRIPNLDDCSKFL